MSTVSITLGPTRGCSRASAGDLVAGIGGRVRRRGRGQSKWLEQDLTFFRGLVNGDDECLENRFGSDRGH
jgi:hypothetical protein